MVEAVPLTAARRTETPMAGRKPRSLKWFEADEDDGGIDGRLPNCEPCRELLDRSLFTQAVYAMAAERSQDPVDLARSAIEVYHAHGHRTAGWEVGLD